MTRIEWILGVAFIFVVAGLVVKWLCSGDEGDC